MRKQICGASVMFLLLIVLVGPAQGASLTQREKALVKAVNHARKAHRVRPLRVDFRLVRAARAHTITMLRIDVLTHGSFGARLASSGARGPRFGENLAFGTGSLGSARAVVRAWLASPDHRANLLRPGFRRIGLGARAGSFAGHRRAVVVTADFAGR
jgi:uncharacterized protein YkwD